MRAKIMARTAGIASVVGLLLTGCVAPPVEIKDVQADPSAYMNSHFAPGQLPVQVYKTVSDGDAGPIGFHQMALHIDWTLNEDDKNKTLTEQETKTLTNVGGSLVQVRAEYFRNGMPITQFFQLSYRNLISLESQGMNLSARIAPMEMQVKHFDRFDAVNNASKATELDYRYSLGTSVQIMNFSSDRTTCARGKTYPATQVFASLAGDAEDMECTNYNANGVQYSKVRYAYLKQYGVAIAVHMEQARGISDGKIASVTIQ